MPEDSKKQKHKYGKYNNVLLTEEEIKQLREKLPKDWENWIETFSEGLELKGYKYNNHLNFQMIDIKCFEMHRCISKILERHQYDRQYNNIQKSL